MAVRHLLHVIFPFIPDSRSVINEVKETNRNLRSIATEMKQISEKEDPLKELLKKDNHK